MDLRLPVLLYHRVGPRDGSALDKYTVSPARFEWQMRWLADHGWQVVHLEEAVRRKFRCGPNRSVALTFDDGFASNRDFAWPVLGRLGFPASTFLVADEVGGVNRWDREQDARFPLLSREDLDKSDQTLMTFHCHGATHTDLTSLTRDPPALAREIELSIARLADIHQTGALFAYPRGSWNWHVKLAVERAGYVAACTCMGGLNSARTDPFLLRRIAICEADVGWRFALKVMTGRDLASWRRPRPACLTIAMAWARRAGEPLPAHLQNQ